MRDDLKRYASQQLLRFKEGTESWLYWRGVLLGVESFDSPHVTTEWAQKVHDLGRNQ